MAQAAPFDSQRLRMRPTVIEDADVRYGDPDSMTWWSSAPKGSVEEVRDYIASRLDWPGGRGWSIRARATTARSARFRRSKSARA